MNSWIGYFNLVFSTITIGDTMLEENRKTIYNNGALSKTIDNHGIPQLYLQNSSMVFHNMGDAYTAYIEILKPYLIMYESINLRDSTSKYFEISLENRIFCTNKISAVDDVTKHSLHKHDFYELTYVLAGTLHMDIEGYDMYYSTGEACFCNRNIRHTEVLDSDCEIVLFMVKEDFLIDLYKGGAPDSQSVTKSAVMHMIMENTSETLLISKRFLDFKRLDSSDSYTKESLPIINQLIEQFTADHRSAQYFIKGYMLRLFLFLEEPSNYEVTFHTLPTSKTESLFLEISNYFRQSTSRATREELERRFHYSSDYLNHVVRKYSGKTLNEYLREYLMQKAAFMLTSSDLSISEICETLGYSNRSFFNKQFKKKFEATPLAYRNAKQQ